MWSPRIGKTFAANGRKRFAQGCGAAQPAALQWPANEIEARLHPNDTNAPRSKCCRTPTPGPSRS